MSTTLKIRDRQLKAAFIERCYDEGVNPVGVLEAWLRRAIRQPVTVQPRASALGNVREIGRRA